MNDRILFIPLVSSLHDPKSVEEVASNYRNWLEGYFDYEIHAVSEIGIKEKLDIKTSAGVLALVVTGGTECLIQSVVGFGRPTIVLAHESMNSLPAVLEALPSIDEPIRPQLLLSRNGDGLNKVKHFVKAAKALARIRRYRLGLIGGPSPWLTYSLPDIEGLSNRLGIRLIDVPMDEFKKEYEKTNNALVTKLAAQARSKASSTEQIKLQDFIRSSTVYVATKKVAEKYDLTAVSLKCFDFISNYKATGCYAVAKLNDEGLVAGCEGDIPATTAMITLSEISGYPSFLANLSFVKGASLCWPTAPSHRD